jgi:hypothetical protein
MYVRFVFTSNKTIGEEILMWRAYRDRKYDWDVSTGGEELLRTYDVYVLVLTITVGLKALGVFLN